MSKIKLNITDRIADTLFITLYAKAVETQKKDPLIIDKSACELVEKIDYDFSKYKNKKASSVGVALRASHFDTITKQFIEKHTNPIVVLVGCGLDSRKQRIGTVADKALFYQLDIEEVIKARRQLLPPDKNEIFLSDSMLNTDWMDEILSKHPKGNFLFIIEGVLMYFSEEENIFFFQELAKQFDNAELHFDMLNKWMSRNSSLHDTVKKTKATFRFGINNDKEIENWHPHLKHQNTWLYKDFKGCRRMGFLFSILMNYIPKFRTNSRLLAYKID